MSIVTPSMIDFASAMKLHARTGIWDGKESTTVLPYFQNANRIHYPTGTRLLLTRDVGYHSSGWFKNPDYEQCWHLSMSFWDLDKLKPRPFERATAKAWCHCFFGEWVRYIWEEGPALELPNEVRHYRVFCNPVWLPIIPRGEVYTRDFTEKGWKSWSDQQYDKAGGQ